MTRREKLVDRLRSRPRDFTWDELVRLLGSVGYREAKPGKSGGSRRRFLHERAAPIALHKPHPGRIVKLYVLDAVLDTLNDEGLL